MSRFFSNKYASLKAYVPGEQPKDMQYIKLNTNESPFPPPPSVAKAVEKEVGLLHLYSDPECTELINAFAERYSSCKRLASLDVGSKLRRFRARNIMFLGVSSGSMSSKAHTV